MLWQAVGMPIRKSCLWLVPLAILPISVFAVQRVSNESLRCDRRPCDVYAADLFPGERRLLGVATDGKCGQGDPISHTCIEYGPMAETLMKATVLCQSDPMPK